METFVRVAEALEAEPHSHLFGICWQRRNGPVGMVHGDRSGVIDAFVAVLHARQYPVFFVESHHETGLVVVFSKAASNLYKGLKITLHFLPMKGRIVDGAMKYALPRLSPTIGTFGHPHDNFGTLDDDLLVGLVVPAFQRIFPVVAHAFFLLPTSTTVASLFGN